MKNTIAIIDLGGQYCHLIARRLRDLGVWSSIHGPEVKPDDLASCRGIILSGGPRSVYEEDAPTISPDVLRLRVPILGICYGHQLLAQMLGAKVERWSSEYGSTTLLVVNQDMLFIKTPKQQTVWMSHSDTVTWLPPGLITLASTEQCENAAFADLAQCFYGVQFHPEVVHTEWGKQILRNFALAGCGARRSIGSVGSVESIESVAPFDPTDSTDPRDSIDSTDSIVQDIRTKVGENSVFFLLSGGVDSTVAFVLCAKALPRDRILGVHVDTGLMRKGETEEFIANLKDLGLADRVHIRRESSRFLDALREITDPEEKRQIIGRLFVEVQADAMREYGVDEHRSPATQSQGRCGGWLLGQGTIYPDTIESGGASGRAAVIKTHHNRCAEIIQLLQNGRVVEPLADFYKDEVRRIGASLGLASKLTNRWPFPGPGLAIRCLCSTAKIGSEPLDPELANLVNEYGYDGILLPIQSVGVQGDARTYRQTVALRGPLDYRALQTLSTKLCNVHTATNRVIVLVSGRADQPLPGGWNPLRDAMVKEANINERRLATLQEADFIARSIMEEYGQTDNVWQFPVVLIPVSFASIESVGSVGSKNSTDSIDSRDPRDSIVLRPVNSEDGMTANFARLPIEVLQHIADEITARLSDVDAVFLDVTNKPPATIEWE